MVLACMAAWQPLSSPSTHAAKERWSCTDAWSALHEQSTLIKGTCGS